MPNEQPLSILLRGGRLPAWYQLPAAKREPIEQAHVDLMLAVAQQYQMGRLEGFRLMAPQGGWERFWVIDFPTMAGAESWIAAEMAPEYGNYGFFDYHLARQTLSNGNQNWLPHPPQTTIPLTSNPHQIPPLDIEATNMVVLLFESDAGGMRRPVRDSSIVPTVAAAHGVDKLELFELIAPNADWDRVWLAEMDTVSTAEKWIEAVASAGKDDVTERHFQLTRKWAPAYFASWIPR